jgi:nucleoside-triphosphatase THEP1
MMKLPRICLLLTGAIGSGKTSAMRSILASLAAEGWRASAILQVAEGRIPDGTARGYSMEYLRAKRGELAAERAGLARELAEGELPLPGSLALGRFVFDRSAFSKAERFMRSALGNKGGAEILGLDEIGRLELLQGEGLMPCLELSLDALARDEGPRILICAVREDCVASLIRIAQEFGLRTETFDPSRQGEALDAARRALTP